MYTIELSKGNTVAILETVKFKKEKDAEEWLRDFSNVLTEGTTAKVVKDTKLY